MPIYIVIWLHLIAAVTLIGGLIFFNFILKPEMEGKNSEIEKKELLQKIKEVEVIVSLKPEPPEAFT